MKLIAADAMADRFPKAWAYLKSWENELRERESGSFDDHEWYRFGRNQNIDKQDITKLIVAQTVPNMRVCADYSARTYLNNVRVNGILPTPRTDQSYLMGALNGELADFVFRRIGKPKQGGWFEANKQFIAPLPIPDAADDDRAEVARRARSLQENWTQRRDLLDEAGRRLGVLARASHKARWLWPDLPDLPDLIERAPKALKGKPERRQWAEEQLDEMEAARVEALRVALASGRRLEAVFAKGELRLLADGAPILGDIFLSDRAGLLAEAYWRWLLLSRGRNDTARFAAELRRPPAETDLPAADQFVDRVEALASLTEEIEAGERAMNELLYRLYGLSSEERFLVENDRARPALL
jgi:hypothetical protein